MRIMYVKEYPARIVAESSRNLEICRRVSKTYYGNSLFCPLSNVSMSVLTVIVIVIMTTYKSSSWLREKGAADAGVQERRKGSFKGSKAGVEFLHVGLLSRHGGTDAVLFYETMNYILWTSTCFITTGWKVLASDWLIINPFINY